MPCPKGIELEKRRDALRRGYMEILNPGNPWRGSVSRSQFEQMTLDAQERYKFAERELSNHKQECEACKSP
jgi:hypothetical protein